jgi:hypothetical protein
LSPEESGLTDFAGVTGLPEREGVDKVRVRSAAAGLDPTNSPALKANAIVIPIEAVRIRKEYLEPHIRDVSTIKIRRRRGMRTTALGVSK